MKHITPHQMIAFHDQLSKEAGWLRSAYGALAKSPGLQKAIGYGSALLPSTYGRQIATGAALGGIAGGATAEEGQGMRGALKGALIGTGIAGGRILATKKGREAAKGGLSRFYQRQKYGVTGRFDPNVGASPEAQLEHARKIRLIPQKVDPSSKLYSEIPETPSVTERVRAWAGGRTAEGQRAKAIRKAQEWEKVNREAFEKGYMSAPGVVHGLLTDPKQLMRGAWQRAGTTGKVFTGLGAYETGKGLIETPEPGGPGRLEKGLRGAGSTVGWLVAPQALIGGQLIGSAGGAVGGTVGKMGDYGVRAARRKMSGPPRQEHGSMYYPSTDRGGQ